jgi:hypothetical protein
VCTRVHRAILRSSAIFILVTVRTRNLAMNPCFSETLVSTYGSTASQIRPSPFNAFIFFLLVKYKAQGNFSSEYCHVDTPSFIQARFVPSLRWPDVFSHEFSWWYYDIRIYVFIQNYWLLLLYIISRIQFSEYTGVSCGCAIRNSNIILCSSVTWIKRSLTHSHVTLSLTTVHYFLFVPSERTNVSAAIIW